MCILCSWIVCVLRFQFTIVDQNSNNRHQCSVIIGSTELYFDLARLQIFNCPFSPVYFYRSIELIVRLLSDYSPIYFFRAVGFNKRRKYH